MVRTAKMAFREALGRCGACGVASRHARKLRYIPKPESLKAIGMLDMMELSS